MTPAMLEVEKIIAEHDLTEWEAATVRMRAWQDPDEAKRIAHSIRPVPNSQRQ